MPIGSYQKFWKHLAKTFNLETFIETGTADGTTLEEVHDGFRDCYSIEITDNWYQHALKRFANVPNVHPVKGDSAVELRNLLLRIPHTRTLFFLDGHFHAAPLPDGKPGKLLNDPLPQEIATIMELRPDALVVIDDQVDNNLTNVVEAGVSLRGWTNVFDGVRMVMLYKQGSGYFWPPFEG